MIRAGGGSPRDTLSVLDQLLAGAEATGSSYPRALALLGATDVALIDDAVDALAAGDAAALFGAVEAVIDAGHDPRRFATDLLERFRDLIVLQAVPDAAARGVVDAPERRAGPDARSGRPDRRGDADALRRGGARRARRDARGHRAAAAARGGVRAAAVALGQRHRIGSAATGRAHRDPAEHVDPVVRRPAPQAPPVARAAKPPKQFTRKTKADAPPAGEAGARRRVHRETGARAVGGPRPTPEPGRASAAVTPSCATSGRPGGGSARRRGRGGAERRRDTPAVVHRARQGAGAQPLDRGDARGRRCSHGRRRHAGAQPRVGATGQAAQRATQHRGHRGSAEGRARRHVEGAL